MVRVRIDLPIFSSPTVPLGYADGELDVLELPREGEVFPWPVGVRSEKPEYFSDLQSTVWSVSAPGAAGPLALVTLYGIVMPSRNEALECSRYLEQTLGLVFNEH